ncbi:MAG: preprotein translocase subunit SecG [Treponema sp.]|nr:preprotein translocase subunit SecG [Treponema sp.]
MGILSVILLVLFVIIAILLVLLVLIQNEEGNSLGGIFAGGSDSAFGSRSGNVLTRATTVLGSLFLIISFGLAILSRTPAGGGVEEEGRRLSVDAVGSSWVETELNPPPPSSPQIQEEFPDGFGYIDIFNQGALNDDTEETQ